LPSDSWIEIKISNATNREAIIASLFAAGSQGVQEAGDDIITSFPAQANIDQLREAISVADRDCVISARPADLPDSRTLQGKFARQTIGSLTIAPPWLAEGLDPATTVILEPAMAFGTGEHATTRGVLRLMQSIPLANKTIADLGAGSAILSIAAVKLGASSAIAVELDADAEGNALENIEANRVLDRVHFINADAFAILPLVAPVDVVFANILSSVLVNLLPVIHDSLSGGGKVILSGILVGERPQMLSAIQNGDWKLEAEDTEGEWWSALISRA
jgi:ribosomal protein L11 methyltransferase